MPKNTLNIKSDLSEEVDYNTPLLPIKARYCRQSWYANKKAPCHWHTDLECIYVLEGSLTYFVNDRTYTLQAGDGIIVNANRLHFCESLSGEDSYYMVLLLSPSCLATNPKMETRFVNPVIFDDATDAILLHPEGWHDNVLTLIQKIFHTMQDDEKSHALTVIQDVFALWDLLYQDAMKKNSSIKSTTHMDALKEMITYVQLHYNEKIALADIAASGMMCESKCCSLFKSAVHQSPMAYLTSYRIRTSLYLLANTNKSITDIALSCGFNSGSYYTETFQKLMKMTPKDYRKASLSQ